MSNEETTAVLIELLNSAKELKEERYIQAFSSALDAIARAETQNRLMLMMEKQLIAEWGVAKYHIFSTKIATDAFRQEIDEMEDSDFKKFLLENFDKITDLGNEIWQAKKK